MRALKILFCLVLMSSASAVAQVQENAVIRPLQVPPPEIVAGEEEPILDHVAERLETEIKQSEQKTSYSQESSRLTQFLYSVAVGVAVAVLSTLILRAIV